MAYAFDTRPRGGDMISIEQRWTRSERSISLYPSLARSWRTWSDAAIRTGERRPEGMCDAIPVMASSIPTRAAILNSGSRESFQQTIRSRVCATGISITGFPATAASLVPLSGHPCGRGIQRAPSVARRVDGEERGDARRMGCVPLVTLDGRILLPVEISPLGADGKLTTRRADTPIQMPPWSVDAGKAIASNGKCPR